MTGNPLRGDRRLYCRVSPAPWFPWQDVPPRGWMDG
jgi:hypothetical protein